MALSKSQILQALMKYKCFKTKTEFAQFLGITPQRLNGWINDEYIDLAIIAPKFPEVSQSFLIDGVGDMLIHGAVPGRRLQGLQMTRSERLKAVYQHLKMERRVSNYSELCEKMGFGDAAYIGVLINKDDSEALPASFIPGLLKVAPDVNMNWVLTGIGEMLVGDNAEAKGAPIVGAAKAAPIIPEEVSASCDCSIEDFLASPEAAEAVTPSMLMPDFDVQYRVVSSNMAPATIPGDILLLAKVRNYASIDDNLYVVDSKICPKLPFYVSFDAGVLRCRSIAEGMKDLNIVSEQINAIWRVVGLVRRDVAQRQVLDNTLNEIIKADRINFSTLMQQNNELLAHINSLTELLKKFSGNE